MIVKKINVPAMSNEELREQITWEAEQHIPFDINDVNLDYHIVDGEIGGNVDVLLVACKKDVVSQLTQVISQAGRTPSMEVGRHLTCGDDRNVVRQGGVERSGDACRGRAAVDVDADDVAECVHPGVGSPRNGEVGERRKDTERVAHDSFDRAQARLQRPAVEMGAVVFER